MLSVISFYNIICISACLCHFIRNIISVNCPDFIYFNKFSCVYFIDDICFPHTVFLTNFHFRNKKYINISASYTRGTLSKRDIFSYIIVKYFFFASAFIPRITVCSYCCCFSVIKTNGRLYPAVNNLLTCVAVVF